MQFQNMFSDLKKTNLDRNKIRICRYSTEQYLLDITLLICAIFGIDLFLVWILDKKHSENSVNLRM